MSRPPTKNFVFGEAGKTYQISAGRMTSETSMFICNYVMIKDVNDNKLYGSVSFIINNEEDKSYLEDFIITLNSINKFPDNVKNIEIEDKRIKLLITDEHNSSDLSFTKIDKCGMDINYVRNNCLFSDSLSTYLEYSCHICWEDACQFCCFIKMVNRAFKRHYFSKCKCLEDSKIKCEYCVKKAMKNKKKKDKRKRRVKKHGDDEDVKQDL